MGNRPRKPWHSTVRATLHLPFEGKTRDEQYALGDLHIRRAQNRPRGLRPGAKVPVRCINSTGGCKFFTPRPSRPTKVRRRRCGQHRQRRPLPDAGEAGRANPQASKRAQGACDQDVSPPRPTRRAKDLGHETRGFCSVCTPKQQGGRNEKVLLVSGSPPNDHRRSRPTLVKSSPTFRGDYFQVFNISYFRQMCERNF
jgi:hypothetical protein